MATSDDAAAYTAPSAIYRSGEWYSRVNRIVDSWTSYATRSGMADKHELEKKVAVRASYTCTDGVCDFSEALSTIASSADLRTDRIAGVCETTVRAMQDNPQTHCPESVDAVVVVGSSSALYLENRTLSPADKAKRTNAFTAVVDAHGVFRELARMRLAHTRGIEEIKYHAFVGAGIGFGAALLCFFAKK